MILRAAMLATVIAAAALLPSRQPSSAAGPFDVPPTWRGTGIAPATLYSGEENLECLVRAQQGVPPAVATTLLCYSSDTLSPMPPPPFNPRSVDHLAGELNETTGEFSMQLLNCVNFFGVVALDATMSVQLDKAGGPASGTITIREDFSAPFDCVDGTESTGPLTLTPLAQSHDEDGDGCADWEELGDSQTSGGLRDPFNFWDYFDTPGPNATPQRDKIIRATDIQRVTARYGTDDDDGKAPINRYTDPLSTPPKTGYHPAYDRSAQALGPNLWNLGPADGMIRVPDIVAVTNQFGHDCVDPP